MNQMKLIYMKVEDLIPYDRNPRINDHAVEAVAASIEEFGFKVPIIIDKDNEIVAGHTRIKAAKMLGMEEVPTIIADDLTDEQVKAFRIADNKTAELAEWDYEILMAELDLLEDIDMEQFGFDDLADMLEPTAEEDGYELEVPDEPRAKLGEVYQLGRHRLMCGDSTKKEDIDILMNGDKADLFLTDPPYNVDYVGGTKEALTITNDNMGDREYRKFLVEAFRAANTVMKAGAAFYIWHADTESYNARGACRDAGWTVRQCLIWNKNSLVMGRQDYHWKHEPCLYGWKEGASHYYIDDRTQTTVFEDLLPKYRQMKKAELVELLDQIYSDKISTTVINEKKPHLSEEHPTMKPIKLLARLINNSTKRKWLTLDLFGGSGSTLIACEQLDRTCYMMELDPRYIDVIIDRWEKLTGQTAELLS